MWSPLLYRDPAMNSTPLPDAKFAVCPKLEALSATNYVLQMFKEQQEKKTLEAGENGTKEKSE